MLRHALREIEGFTTGTWLDLCDYVGVICVTYFKKRLEWLRIIELAEHVFIINLPYVIT